MALAVLLGGCGGGVPSDSATRPGDAALRLFALARRPGLDREELGRILEPRRLAEDPLGALETVAALREAEHPRVVDVEPLTGIGRTAVDVEASLEGGGVARYSFQVTPSPDGTWRVVSIATPAREWPMRAARGPGLSVSAPAGEAGR